MQADINLHISHMLDGTFSLLRIFVLCSFLKDFVGYVLRNNMVCVTENWGMGDKRAERTSC